MITKAKAILLAASVGILAAGCSDSPTGIASGPVPPTPEQEAQLAALGLSGNLHPPGEVVARIRLDLAIIREGFGAHIPQLGQIYYESPWVPGSVHIMLDDQAVHGVRTNTYHAWDANNAWFHVVRIDTTLIRHRYVVLGSRDMIHAKRMAESYEGLDGVTETAANGADAGDGSRVYLRRTDSGYEYLFRNAWGDCLAGCTSAEYWLFRSTADDLEFRGYWSTESADEAPSWWGDAQAMMEAYRDW